MDASDADAIEMTACVTRPGSYDDKGDVAGMLVARVGFFSGFAPLVEASLEKVRADGGVFVRRADWSERSNEVVLYLEGARSTRHHPCRHFRGDQADAGRGAAARDARRRALLQTGRRERGDDGAGSARSEKRDASGDGHLERHRRRHRGDRVRPAGVWGAGWSVRFLWGFWFGLRRRRGCLFVLGRHPEESERKDRVRRRRNRQTHLSSCLSTFADKAPPGRARGVFGARVGRVACVRGPGDAHTSSPYALGRHARMSLSVATNFLADRCASARRFERSIEAEQSGSGRAETPPGRLTCRSSPASARLVTFEARGARHASTAQSRSSNRPDRSLSPLRADRRSPRLPVAFVIHRVRLGRLRFAISDLQKKSVASSGGDGTPCSAW